MRLAIGWPAGNMSMTSEVAVPAEASVKAPVDKDAGSARTEAHREGWIGVITGATAERHRRGNRVGRDVDGAVFGKPTKSKAWVNQIEVPSK